MTQSRTTELREALLHRYAQHYGNGPRYVTTFEVRSAAGFGTSRWAPEAEKMRTCDALVCDTWSSGPPRLIGHELKVSRSDWLAELKNPHKAAAFTPWVSQWYLVVAERAIVKDGELPEGWGLMVQHGATLRTAVTAPKRPQPPIPGTLLAALLRATDRDHRAAFDRHTRQPFEAHTVPMAPVRDAPPFRMPDGWRTGDIADPRHSLRTPKPRR